jgi:lipoprotein-anchoring transpeptidase ErfK/SrfK
MGADMRFANLRILLALAGLFTARLHAQTVQPGLQGVQPGLEAAVKWKWSVLPSEEKDWGLPIVEPPPTPATPAAPSIEPGNYEVKKGDALAIIARKSGVSVTQLKLFNGLTNDVIRLGQILKIPTPAEVAALVPPVPVMVKPAPATPTPEPKKVKKAPEKVPAEPVIDYVAEATLIQVFLDRENFSSGPIDGTQGAAAQMVLGIYAGIHQDMQSPAVLRAKAVEVVGDPYTTYKLQRSDFRFIAPPKATPPTPKPVSAPVGAKKAVPKGVPVPATPVPAPRPSVTYEELLAVSYSAYRTPWEFVAERFHCDEAFLRRLNPNIKNTPTAETTFKVPNVKPFEIEKCFEAPLQPKADPAKPITATIVELTRLEIRRGDELIASMPMSIARPRLKGKGSWTILGATAGPRLSTHQEPSSTPKPPTEPGATAPEPTPPAAPLGPEQILAAGPRNPVGVYWIDLAKGDSTTPLPYGLHGTAVPNRMRTQESLGGLRLTNWDIARAVRMLPEGTPLTWK